MVHSKPEVLELVESVRGSAGEAGKGSSGFAPFGLGASLTEFGAALRAPVKLPASAAPFGLGGLTSPDHSRGLMGWCW